MKPEQQIRTTYADILNQTDPATIRLVGDLDALYTSATIPTAPPFRTLVATHTRTTSNPAEDDPSETSINTIAGGSPPRSRHNWLRQGFAFAGAAIAFAVVATILVLLFRSSDDESTRGAQPTTTPQSVFEIVYVSVRDNGQSALIAARSDGSGQRTIMTDNIVGQPAWSPDGRWIAVAADGDRPAGLYLLDASTGAEQQLTSTDEETFDQSPIFSDDGSMIAFVRATTSNGSNIWLIDTDGGEPRQLTALDGYQVPGSWSPDGTRIAFTNIPPDSTTADVYVISTAGGTARKLTSNPGWDAVPDWSPDGSQIMFQSDASGESDIVVVNLDGSNLRNLTATTPGNSITASWSPDGEWIAFLHEEDGKSRVSVMQADGSQMISLTEVNSYNPSPVWSPNSLQLAFTILTSTEVTSTTPTASTTVPGELRVINRDGSDDTILGDSVDTSVRPVWSPVPVLDHIVTPVPSPPNPSPTVTMTTSGTLDALGPLQPGQERVYIFDVQADYRTDESNFLAWTVEGHERMLTDGTLQQRLIARDHEDNVIADYAIDGERWLWKQRGWIESGTVALGVVEIPGELKLVFQEPTQLQHVLTEDIYEILDERFEGNRHITRYLMPDSGISQQASSIESDYGYYEVWTAGDPARIQRTRMVLMTADNQEYVMVDITFVFLTRGPVSDTSNPVYTVPEAPTEGTLQYTPPATLPDGLTLERHWREFPGGMERMTIVGDAGFLINGLVLPSRGGVDPRQIEYLATTRGGMTVWKGNIADGDIVWIAEDSDGWPGSAIWDNGRYRFDLNISNVASSNDWNEAMLAALIYALAGEAEPG